MENNSTRGEPDLLVFISSVMDDELNKARCIVQKVFFEFPITRPWAFEYTPASSTSPEDEYLENQVCRLCSLAGRKQNYSASGQRDSHLYEQ